MLDNSVARSSARRNQKSGSLRIPGLRSLPREIEIEVRPARDGAGWNFSICGLVPDRVGGSRRLRRTSPVIYRSADLALAGADRLISAMQWECPLTVVARAGGNL
jgi:hypothetical protein